MCPASDSGAAYPADRDTNAAVTTDLPPINCGISRQNPKSPSLARLFSSINMLCLCTVGVIKMFTTYYYV